MKIRTQNFAWTMVAGLYVLLSGAPALADDTELLLLNPSAASQPKPNILFILDTSGSMGTFEDTIEPYDSSNSYSGNCDDDYLYWSDTGVAPICDGNETQFIEKDEFECDFATNQINGIGSYSDTMVQWRESAVPVGGGSTIDVWWWQTLEPGNEDDVVECQSDSGIHGDGDPLEFYATAFGYTGGGSGNPWVSDPSQELSWGSAPRNVQYTVYDGNFLNWQSNPTTVSLRRIEIVREVTKTVLDSINNVNVGVMRFNQSDGGPVIQAVVDLDTNRTAIKNTIDSLVHGGATPVSEALYESALYWHGLPAYYGETINEHTTDPNALSQLSPEIYKSPVVDACAKNYNVLLTDGQPVNDAEAHTLVPTLPGFTSVTGYTQCTTSAQGECLDETAEYLRLADTDPLQADTQYVTTHTIGFAINLPILEDAAAMGGGEYFLANDVQSLTIALLQIVNDITDQSLAFSAPAVSVNTFNRTRNLNDIYLTMFGVRSKVHWPGNLKKYSITNQNITDANDLAAVNAATGFFKDTAESFWSGVVDGNDVLLGGAASLLPAPSGRLLYTYNGSDNNLTGSSNDIDDNNGGLTSADFGLTGASGEPSKAELIRWMHGEDLLDEDGDGNTTEARKAMGDPLHSQPASIVYGGTPANPDIVVYTATNDGYLHAIDGSTGQELWSFVPKELLGGMARLYFDPDTSYKNYGLDGNIVPVIKDENKNGIVDGNDFVRIVFGMRRGGNTYYALDVTNKYQPQLLWAQSPAEVSQSWSTPVVTRVDAPNVNADQAVVIIGGGYDSAHDTNAHPTVDDASGAAIIMLDLETGNELWRASRNAGGGGLSLPAMKRAIPGQVRVIDVSGDGLADRMYASDMGGQILRFDIYNGQPVGSLVTGGVIAQVGAEGLGGPTLPDTRRFFASPDVSIFTSERLDKRFMAISIGSGYRAHPLDNINTDRFYSFRDADVFNQLTQIEYDNYQIIRESDLVEVSGQVQVELTDTDRGWMFTLPYDQKVLTDSITFDDSVFFVAFSPSTNAGNLCATGAGTNFLYRVSVVNGDPVVDYIESVTAGQADDERRTTLQQGGIAPTPTILFPSPDDPNCTGAACSPPPIGCVGVECFDPGFANNPVRTLWTQDGIL